MSLSTKIVEILVDNDIFLIFFIDKDKSKKTHFLLVIPLVVDW
jgi:hypothetical protein